MAYQQGQQQQRDNGNSNNNRLHLNFGFNNQQAFAGEQGRAFPTTPSTFPQPFPNSNGQQEVWGTQQTTSGINSQGYFYNNPNPYQQYGAHGLPSPGPAAGYRPPGGFNDVNNGLAHQFQHQNLGGNTPRTASPYRQPSPAGSRPRTGGQPQYGNYLSTNTAPAPQGPSIYDDEPPAKNSEKYSNSVSERTKLQKMLTQEFFKENVERARARNER
jgi:protein-serine/threonine kinase